MDGKRLDVVVELCLRYGGLGQLRCSRLVLKLVARLLARDCAHHLQLMDVSLMKAAGHELATIQWRQVSGDLAREVFPALLEQARCHKRRRLVIVVILWIREGQVLDGVTDIGHPRVQRLITTPGHELQVPWHTRHLQPATGIAATLEGLMVLTPARASHLRHPREPENDLRLPTSTVVDCKGAVGPIEPQCRVGIDAFFHTGLLEVHAVQLDQPNRTLDAILVGKLHAWSITFAVDLLGNSIPLWGELLTMTAPSSKKVDESEIMALNDMLEALVLETIVRGRPIRIDLLRAILLPHFLHDFVMIIFFLLLPLKLLGPHRRSKGFLRSVNRSQPEIFPEHANLFFPVLSINNDLQVPTLDVMHIYVEVDLQRIAACFVQGHKGGVPRAGEGCQLEQENYQHDAIRDERPSATDLGCLDEIPGEPSCCMARSEHPLCAQCLSYYVAAAATDDLSAVSQTGMRSSDP